MASNDHGFSVELKSKRHVRNISLSNEGHEAVLFEGVLGELVKLAIVEGTVLRVEGAKGTLMLDLSRSELLKVLGKTSQNDTEEG
ncbi:MAG: hypothetical protein JSV27_02805 [Candidatus Bathyarchaeota archaeon]|nr:MAG: hypothetical protein JSV27_02805 [Candidatus Bathyarchaeota archaeon]